MELNDKSQMHLLSERSQIQNYPLCDSVDITFWKRQKHIDKNQISDYHWDKHWLQRGERELWGRFFCQWTFWVLIQVYMGGRGGGWGRGGLGAPWDSVDDGGTPAQADGTEGACTATFVPPPPTPSLLPSLLWCWLRFFLGVGTVPSPGQGPGWLSPSAICCLNCPWRKLPHPANTLAAEMVQRVLNTMRKSQDNLR